MVNKRNSWW